MGYNIYIGERIQHEDGHWIVREVEQDRAPCWRSSDHDQDLSGHSNGRHPSYRQLTHFARRTGLQGLFVDLLDEHPGIVDLTQDHLDAVQTALERWQRQHPDRVAGWLPGEDSDLARLLWYRWWMAWALQHCERPSVWNC